MNNDYEKIIKIIKQRDDLKEKVDEEFLKLFNGTTDFTMSPSSSSSNAIGVYAVDWYGNIAPYNAGYGYNIYPVLFLKSAVKIVGGTGTSTDPYTLG